ncbi:uncharacterized protein [Palaemon carinicauda]|uniref:uncharacterized protein n=1 Tax=Palaemon carinicauda TaxID=392227 RepID=UPI0035B59124
MNPWIRWWITLNFYLKVTDIDATCNRLVATLNFIKDWMNHKQLNLNVGKTQYLQIGRRHDLRNANVLGLNVDCVHVRLVDNVKDLGVHLDNSLSVAPQINNVVKASAYHLGNIAFVRKYLDEDSAKKLVHNCVISRLDYCNSLYYGLPNYHLNKRQNIFNRSTRLIIGVIL